MEGWEMHSSQVSYSGQSELNSLGLSSLISFRITACFTVIFFYVILHCYFLIKEEKSTIKNKSVERCFVLTC